MSEGRPNAVIVNIPVSKRLSHGVDASIHSVAHPLPARSPSPRLGGPVRGASNKTCRPPGLATAGARNPPSAILSAVLSAVISAIRRGDDAVRGRGVVCGGGGGGGANS
jgi:hypothetical protein